MPRKDPEARKAYLKAYAERNAEKLRAYREAYRAANHEKILKGKKEYWQDNAEQLRAQLRERYANDPEKYKAMSRAQYVKAAERNREYAAAYRAANSEQVKQGKQLYQRKNKHVVNASVARRSAAKAQRTPSWLSDDDHWMMQEAYELAKLRSETLGFLWHVDHVVPLRGKLVSGLHVPWNMQVIPAKENVSKRNKFEVS